MGGGITSVNATELRDICKDSTSYCNISSTYPTITNHGDFISKHTNSSYTDGIYFGSGGNNIDLFINYGSITTYYNEKITTNTFTFSDGPGFKALINYGTLSGGVNANASSIYITNYGKMGGASTKGTVTIANYGEINLLNGNGKKHHFKDVKSLTLQNYAMKIKENQTTFNGFSGNAIDNSHLVLDNVTGVSFADKNSKLILDFGSGFEFGAGYLFSKLVVDTSGNNALGVDLSRLIPRNDIYLIRQSGDKFVVHLAPQHSIIGNLYKSNVRTMNNFYLMSNLMIYPRKSQNLGKKNLSFTDSTLDSANILKSYESFAYRNESVNRRIQRQNKRNYNRKLQNLKENQRTLQNLTTDSANQNNSSLRADSQNLRGNPNNQRYSQNQAQNPRDYYFILTPFINHNYFFETGRYNLSGFDYGFLTAFSARIAESNSLGAHFMMSYGSLSDSKDKDLSIKNLNLNVGLNYKLDLIYDMYLKARGDFYYFLNQTKTLTMIEAIKPNNLGFGASVVFGKDFDFGKGGILGIEAGIDYKALKTNEVLLNSQTYKQSLYNLIYADVGINYSKYFGGFGINLGAGFKANLAPKLAESALLINTQTLKFTLDNDKYLGYANAGISYLMQTNKFDMEFSLAYYGNYGDRVISNGGGVEWRVGW